jgi:acetyl-CoA carboxylase biotin carboxyl carrier protein
LTEHTIVSPLPGTFYRRPSPDSPPFVEESAEVKTGDVIGLVEIMKSFHEVRSDADGRLVRFLVENEALVDVGDGVAVLELAAQQ